MLKKHYIIKFVLPLLIIILALCACAGNSVERQLSLGERYLEELDYERAILAFEEIIETEPACVEAYINLYNAYMATGDVEKAVEVLKKGYDYTNSDEIYKLLIGSESFNVSVSSEPGYYEDGIELSFIHDDTVDVYYGIGVQSTATEKYTKPLELKDGLYHIVVQARGKYSKERGSVYEFEYIVGPVPKGMEEVKCFGFLGRKYSMLYGMVDGALAVQSKKTGKWGSVDMDFNEITPMQDDKPFWADDGKLIDKAEHAIIIYIKGKDNSFKGNICNYLDEPISDLEIDIPETLNCWIGITDPIQLYDCYWEKIIPFSVGGKFGVMNILGEVIAEPQYVGMVNADNDMIIANTEDKGTVLLKAVY